MPVLFDLNSVRDDDRPVMLGLFNEAYEKYPINAEGYIHYLRVAMNSRMWKSSICLEWRPWKSSRRSSANISSNWATERGDRPGGEAERADHAAAAQVKEDRHAQAGVVVRARF